jgi:ABC-type uncharacterized transport system permease subunit
MPLLWLRISVALYGVGLLYALLALSRRSQALVRFTFPAVALGMVFQFVSIVETARLDGHLAPATIHDSESLLAFLVMVFFVAIYARYRTLSPGIFVFPLVFLLTFAAAIGKEPPQFASPLLRSGWIVLHITLIFSGYAALFFSFAASLLYLLQERGLKAKQSAGIVSKLPALEVIDDIGYKSLLLGFPFMTLGLIVGAAIAQAEFGAGFFRDPKILLSILMWAVYMVLLFTRWSAGWRGRRAAFMSTVAFLAAVGAWAANYFSGVHRFTAP